MAVESDGGRSGRAPDPERASGDPPAAAGESILSVELIREVLTNSREVFWVASPALDRLYYVSPAISELLGLAVEDVYARAPRWIRAIDPADRERLVRAVQNRAALGQPLEFEHRARRPDGGVRWLRMRLFAIRDANGRIDRIGGLAEDITLRRDAERALGRAEERFRQLMANTNQVFFIVATSLDVLHYVSPGFEPLTGVGTDEVYANPSLWLEMTHPEDRDLLARAVLGRKPGQLLDLDYRIVRRDGAVRWVNTRSFPMRDAEGEELIAGISHDITERKQAELAVRASEERFRQIMDSTSHLFWLSSLDGQVLHYASPGFEKLVGVSVEKAMRQTQRWGDYVHPEDRRRIRETYPTEGLREAIELEYRILRADGDVRWVRTRLFPVGEGADQRLGGIIHDITDQRRAQQALRDSEERYERELETHNEELRRANRAKDEFLATLAHELRNPLAAISNALELLGEGPERSARERLEGVIRRQTAQLSRLVEDLLDVARITTGRIQLRSEPLDLSPIVAAAVESLRAPIEAKGLKLALQLPREPLFVEGDATRLEQVVSNLISNALRYTESGRIDVALARQGDDVMVRVRDSGVGIVADDLPHVWSGLRARGPVSEPFGGGMGLGLRVVRELVELHGGRVAAHSPGEGLGSEFELYLRAVPRPATIARVVEEKVPGPRHRVLVIDDDDDVVQTLAEVLELWGHEVRTASDGPSGISAARQFQPRFALVDLGLPGLSGHDVARALRADRRFDGTTLVAVTGYGQADDVEKSERSGFDHHVIKPNVLGPLRAILEGT